MQLEMPPPPDVASLETASANVTNTYGPGSLEITKSIEWGNVTPFNSTFEICIEGPSWPSGDCQNATHDGQVLTWNNLMPGVYNITETNPGTQWSVLVDPDKVTVATNQIASANVTNTYITCKGEIEILKLKECGQGCTPGYWKQEQHFADWPTGYNPSAEVGDVFTILNDCSEDVGELADDTLLYALEYNQHFPKDNEVLKAAMKLLRHAVAAVLNAASPGVDYPRTVDGIITAVNNALATCNEDTMLSLKDELEADNELGCPLGEPTDGCCTGYLGGATFTVTPNPYPDGDTLTVKDNEPPDAANTTGLIRLENVPCGNYTITEDEAPPGYIKITGSQTVTVTYNSTETATFYNQKECDGCLKICKYEDENGNGNKDDGEPYLSGWSFNISGPEGYFETVTTTDSCDFGDAQPGCVCDYCVTRCHLIPGEYTITETLKDGWICTTDAGNPPQRTVTVECEETITVEFGNQQEEECDGCLKIYKYEDENGNGNKDAGEPYLSGWTFNVTGPDGYFETVTTDSCDFRDATEGLGHDYCDYCVTLCHLVPGEYTITEVTPLPEGWTNTDPGGDPPYKKTVTVECEETITVEFGNQNTIEHGCAGLTPGYWKNWSNHYTEDEFIELLEGTIAEGSISIAKGIFSPNKKAMNDALLKLKSQLLATQLTLNLTGMPNMPNPDNAYLTEDCSVKWNGEVWTVGEAVDKALDILKNPRNYTPQQILEVKDILDTINKMGD